MIILLFLCDLEVFVQSRYKITKENYLKRWRIAQFFYFYCSASFKQTLRVHSISVNLGFVFFQR